MTRRARSISNEIPDRHEHLSELRKDDRANRGVLRWSSYHDTGVCAISVVTLGEIRRGIEDLRRRDLTQALVLERWLHELQETFQGQVLEITADIADQWGRLMSGYQLPPLDAWLAATAVVYDLTIVTRNTADFERAGVRVVNPFT
jgi:predicted nucleic acid-binding protein